MKLRNVLPIFMVLAVAFALCAYAAPQQKHDGKSQSITGCLQKGDTDNDYKLTADGKTYKLMAGSSVNLSPHVGHKVTITGNMTSDSAKTSSSSTTDKNELTVTEVKHVSNTCP